MVSSIKLGNIFTQNDKTVLTGGNSGIDTEALLNSLADAKRLPAVQLEERIEQNTARSTAFSELRDILNRFRDASNFLRNPPGVQNETENIFEYRNATINSNTSVAGSTYLSVTAQPGATLADYDVTVDQLATRNIKTTETFALTNADTSAVGGAGPFNAGTLVLGPNNVNITLVAGDTLNEVVAKINAVKDTSGVEASILKVADGQYRLSFITTQTGAAQNYVISGYDYAQPASEIVIEAEAYSSSVTRQNLTFTSVADGAATGGNFVEVPNASGDVGNVTSNYETSSAQLDYDVNFTSAGTYYIHVRGRGNSSDDSLSIGLDGAAVQADGDSITGFNAASFTYSSNAGGMVAKITVDEPGYHKLNLYMREDGTDIDQIILTTNPAYVPTGAEASTGTAVNAGIFNVNFAIEQNAQDAELTVNGTQVSRATNNIDDVFDDVTFNLLQATPPGTELDVEVEPDTEIVKTAILNFVDAYNEFRIFAARQSSLNDDGTPTTEAVLAGDSSLRAIISRVANEISAVVNGIAVGDPSRLTDIGISFNDFPGDEETPFTRNVLNVDEAALDSALSADFDAVRRVFEFDYTSDNPNLQIFEHTKNLSVSSLVLNIDQTNDVYQATFTVNGTPTTINLDAEDLTSTPGVVLRGQAGSLLDGLTMVFADSVDTTVNLTLTQGVADRVFNSIDDLLEEDSGLVDLELQNIEDSTTRYEEEIRRIDEQVEVFRDQLLRRFSALESAIAQANALLQNLAAQAEARAAG